MASVSMAGRDTCRSNMYTDGASLLHIAIFFSAAVVVVVVVVFFFLYFLSFQIISSSFYHFYSLLKAL